MKSLFDLSFNRFIAPTVAKVVYVLVMIVIALFYILFVVTSFRTNGLLGAFVLLILGPLVAFLYLVLVRIGLESLLASIKTAQNTAELVRLAGGTTPPPGQHYGEPMPPYPSQPAAPYPSQPGNPPTV